VRWLKIRNTGLACVALWLRATWRWAHSLPQGAVNELLPYEREHRKDHDEQRHQHNAEGDHVEGTKVEATPLPSICLPPGVSDGAPLH
jgi:hypothetical protein